MADLSILTQGAPNKIVEAWYEADYKPRHRLGISEVGHKCSRYLWYVHNDYPAVPPEGRLLRLFQLGNLIEDQVITDLLTAGFKIYGRQREKMLEFDGIQIKGHCDGIIENLMESSKPHLLEIKSSNEKRFKKLVKSGYEKWDEKYKAQGHVSMLGMGLKRCLVWVENKNDSTTYTERISLDKDYALKVLEKAFSAISSTIMPSRVCPKPDWFEAKWCKFYPVCFR